MKDTEHTCNYKSWLIDRQRYHYCTTRLTNFCGISLTILHSFIHIFLPVPVAARLLRLWVRIPFGAWTFVCCECCVMSGRGLCDELITRPEESYRLWRVVVCDLETSKEEAKAR